MGAVCDDRRGRTRVTQKNVDDMAKSDKPELKRAFGTDAISANSLGLPRTGCRGSSRRRQLRRIVRSQCRPRLKLGIARGLNHYGTRRNSVRAADPLIAVRLDGDDHHRITSTPVAAGLQAATHARRARLERNSRFRFCLSPPWSGLAMRSWPTHAPICRRSGSTSGFGFLDQTAASRQPEPDSLFGIGYLHSRVPGRLAEHAGGRHHRIFFATIIGFIVALGRLSPNWLLSRISGGSLTGAQPAAIVPDLFWYRAVLATLRTAQGYALFDSVFLSNRGLVIPKPVANPGLEPFALAVLIAITGALWLRRYARKQLFENGRLIRVWPYVLGLLIGLPLLASLVFGHAVTFEFPRSGDSILPVAHASFRNSWR